MADKMADKITAVLYLKRLYFISSGIAYCISLYASFYAGLSCKIFSLGCRLLRQKAFRTDSLKQQRPAEMYSKKFYCFIVILQNIINLVVNQGYSNGGPRASVRPANHSLVARYEHGRPTPYQTLKCPRHYRKKTSFALRPRPATRPEHASTRRSPTHC